MDPSGLMHLELGEGVVTVKLRTREGDAGRVIHLVIYTPGGHRLSMAFQDPGQARTIGAGALKVAEELLNQTGRWPI